MTVFNVDTAFVDLAAADSPTTSILAASVVGVGASVSTVVVPGASAADSAVVVLGAGAIIFPGNTFSNSSLNASAAAGS